MFEFNLQKTLFQKVCKLKLELLHLSGRIFKDVCYKTNILRTIKKRIYSKEFKSLTVQLSYNRSNIKEFADELGISVQRIYKWRKAAKEASAPKQETPLAQEQLEIKRLKKAVHIFSKSDGKYINL